MSRAALPEAAALLAGAGRVLLVPHVEPDPDALGSALALGLALRRRGADVQICWGGTGADAPPRPPDVVAHLPGLDLLVGVEQAWADPDVLAVVDSSSPDRLGVLVDRAGRAGTVLVVDHHASGEVFGDVRVVEPSESATVVLVAELLEALGADLDAELAAPLLLGLVTDTGSFSHASTTPPAHRLAARLLETGVDASAVRSTLRAPEPFAVVVAGARAVAAARLHPGAAAGLGAVCTWVERDDALDVLGTTRASERALATLRGVGGADVTVVVRPLEDGWAVSSRSRVSDVGAACGALGGGGHARAAGFRHPGPPAAAVEALLDELADTAG